MNAINDIVPPKMVAVIPSDAQLLMAVRLAKSMWAESGTYQHLDPDVDTLIRFAYTIRADPESFVRVVMAGNMCQGFIVGSLAPLGFHVNNFAYDRMLYVTPTKRGSVCARILIKAFERWAYRNGAAHILLGTTTGVHSERTEKLYNKLGYRTVGALTMKEI